MAVLACAPCGVRAMERPAWEPALDVSTAGAAASVVLHHACTPSAKPATLAAAQRLRDQAWGTGSPDAAHAYAIDAFDRKVRALWQSSGGRCQDGRLRDMALSTGYAVPADALGARP